MKKEASGKEIEKGKQASAKGFANENRLLAALLGRGYNVSKVDLPLSSYDLVLEIEKENKKEKDMIRIQVKTVSSSYSVSFMGGTRGGKDRTYKSGVKTYKQTTNTSDVVVGVLSKQWNGNSISFYVIPTIVIEKWGTGSKSVRNMEHAKNNLEYLRRCKERGFVLNAFGLL